MKYRKNRIENYRMKERKQVTAEDPGKRRAITAALAVCLSTGMMAPGMILPVSAATHDAVEDVSSDTASIVMSKILTVNQKGQFPGLADAHYQLEAVKAFDNANEDAGASGKTIPAANMPMPAASSDGHHSVRVDGTKASVTVGDFRTDEKDTDTIKSRETTAKIQFSRAGYYVYKLTETGSTPEKVPGMTYDDHSYFVVVYVTNKTDKGGNTVDGVYVHNITSYRNESGSDRYQPDLSDIAGVTDNGGKAASGNTREQLEKVGSSDSEHPDRLDTYRFWNGWSSQDLVIRNNVSGNLGDREKNFEFTVHLTGLQPGGSYSTEGEADQTGDRTSEGTDLIRADKGQLEGRSITADADGNADIVVRMKDDEQLVIRSLPVSAKYQVTEGASDHIADVSLKGSNEKAVIKMESKANDQPDSALSTEEETVDSADGTVTVRFNNTRTLTPLTGVAGAAAPGAMLLIAIAGILTGRRRGRNGAR